jgi:hypothetical protein
MPSGAGDASDSPSVPPPPSSIAIPAGEKYTGLRQAADLPTPRSQPAVDEPSPAGGFDLPSAAIGAATGAGLVMVLLAAGLVARRRPLTRRHGTIGA